MSKERELIEALRQSIDDTSATAEAARQGASGAATTANSGMDLADILDLCNDILVSIANDPVFYVKIAGVLVMIVLILIVSYYLIAGG